MSLIKIEETAKARELGFKWPDTFGKTPWGNIDWMLSEWEEFLKRKKNEALEEAKKELKTQPLDNFHKELEALNSRIVRETTWREGSSDLVFALQYKFVQYLIREVSRDRQAVFRLNPHPQ